ncbi:hypothetical protein HNQ91_001782 [Filimonas zeae]|uniref:Uncharacterized protein n=1 Tax=Filimonas zeae TaxID=1737353 RepID=A0A917IY85_9BACT|nr:hypothetical protein [Filimonas zeae]MDR6338731.1 hypothetical protein [Filimonas zeae]GGH66858.1 hypothetical protein GCM10011379_21470 [Filimonas zeae]
MLKIITTSVFLILIHSFLSAQQLKPAQQLVNAVFTNKTDTAIRLVIPVVYNGQKERLAISRKDLVIYMDALMLGCQNTDTIKKVLVRILEGKQIFTFSMGGAISLNLQDYHLLRWRNTYLLNSPANRNYFLNEVLQHYSEEGAYFLLKEEYEGDDYIVEALQQHNMLVKLTDAGSSAIRSNAVKPASETTSIATPAVDTLMGKLVTLIFESNYTMPEFIQLSIPATFHNEKVRIVIDRHNYNFYMRDINPAFRNTKLLQQELTEVLSNEKEWILNDNTKRDKEFLQHCAILRGKNPYPGPEEMSTAAFLKKYLPRDKSFTYHGLVTIDCKLRTHQFIDAMFRHHWYIAYNGVACYAQGLVFP